MQVEHKLKDDVAICRFPNGDRLYVHGDGRIVMQPYGRFDRKTHYAALYAWLTRW